MNQTYRLQRNLQTLTVEGVTYSTETLALLRERATRESSEFLRDLYDFWVEWLDESPLLKVHTSGSTGKPKELLVRKDQMMNSARLTCSFLRLQTGDRALLCMPLRYIAGKMVVVRALVSV